MEMSGNINNLSGDAAIAYLHEQEKIRKARTVRRWIWAAGIVVALFVLMIGCGIAVGAAASGSSSRASAATPAATPAPTASASPGLREETRIVPVPPTAVSEPAIVAPETTPGETDSSLSGLYGPGTYLVGRDLPPGDYWTRGSTTGHSGYAERLSGTTGDYDEGIGIVSVPENGPAQITILASDHAVEFYGTDIYWTKV